MESGELEDKKGFTPRFQQKVLLGLQIHREAGQKQHIHRATVLLEAAKENLASTNPDLRNITIGGDLRRQCELVEDLSLVAISDKPRVAKPVLGDITLHLCCEENFGSTLLLATNSPAHIHSLVTLAKEKHLTLTPDGLTNGQKRMASQTEGEIYHALGLAFIPPELREGQGEIGQAKHKTLRILRSVIAVQPDAMRENRLASFLWPVESV